MADVESLAEVCKCVRFREEISLVIFIMCEN